jgi:hypothetical protein
MTTGSFQNWAGSIADIGPIYPFVGFEAVMWIVAIVLWIAWHVVQTRRENEVFRDEIKRFGKPETLRKIVEKEDPSNP